MRPLQVMNKIRSDEERTLLSDAILAQPSMSQCKRRLLFVLFLLSGFSGLVYQVIWVRIAFAAFGIIIPLLSVVVSVFMLGLSVGAWAGGRCIKPLVRKTGWSALWFYAGAELIVGIGAFVVPALFAIGQKMLLSAGEANSTRYLFLSALALAFSILPWCILMGTTFPFMMAFVREQDYGNTESFSFLYLANVLGAMAGTLLSAVVLVELLGLHRTLWVAAASNFSVAIMASLLALSGVVRHIAAGKETEPSTVPCEALRRPASEPFILPLLFLTGFVALAMEVIWVRSFTPVLKTQVYSFALIVFAYLGATFLGSSIYRRDLQTNSVRSLAVLLSVLSVAAFLPIVFNDLRFLLTSSYTIVNWGSAVVLLSICPFCAALGYLTPKLIDSCALGDPTEAGRAYAVNVFGSILGPLVASYVLLPWLGERIGLVVLGAPFLLLFILTAKVFPTWYKWATTVTATALLLWSVFNSVDFARFVYKNFENTEIRRDYAASVVSTGRDFAKRLFVNGIGMTSLLPATKCMAHFPLAVHAAKPESALIICFGMGTTYRSAISWDIKTVAVELIPSVKQAFGFYHADASQVLRNPNGQVIIDDGRRYLARTREKFDVIIIDPPPPAEAAGSSLLYSEEFYELVKARLKPDGIVGTWVPSDAPIDSRQAILRSLVNSFSSVRCFLSVDNMGLHMLASEKPLPNLSANEIASKIPAAAAIDLLEWDRSVVLADYVQQLLSNEISIKEILTSDPHIRITDDRPYNEYFLLRRLHNYFAFR